MKKFTSLLIGLSLVLAGAAFAQQTEETPAPGKKQGTTEKAGKTRAEKTAKPEATAKQAGATGEQGVEKGRKAKATEKPATGAGTETGVAGQTPGTATTEQGAGKGRKGRAKAETSAAAGTNAGAEPSASASTAPGGKAGRQKGKAAGANAKASAAPSMTPATAASASAAPTVAASASAAPSVAATGATGQQITTANATRGTVKADPQKVQQVKQQTAQIKQQHVNFKAQPRPDKVPAATFTQNYRIQGSESWSGPQYEVFRSYHPERHDQGWYRSHYGRVELIGGGYYYWNNGYWYPAWGYDPGHEYYAYDAPIYVGHRAEPPDRVIADVQAELQQMGYYQGEVDGLLGPLTRQALTDYQADQGLQVTAVIDEPTLDSLGMS
jgi:Putative peptidoglycan binding domain